MLCTLVLPVDVGRCPALTFYTYLRVIEGDQRVFSESEICGRKHGSLCQYYCDKPVREVAFTLSVLSQCAFKICTPGEFPSWPSEPASASQCAKLSIRINFGNRSRGQLGAGCDRDMTSEMRLAGPDEAICHQPHLNGIVDLTQRLCTCFGCARQHLKCRFQGSRSQKIVVIFAYLYRSVPGNSAACVETSQDACHVIFLICSFCIQLTI